MFAPSLKITFLALFLISGFPTKSTAITPTEAIDFIHTIDRYGKAAENFIKAIQPPSEIEENSARSETTKTSQDSQNLPANPETSQDENFPKDI